MNTVNNHYYSVDKKYTALRYFTISLYVLAALVVLYALYQLLNSAPRGGKNMAPIDMAMQGAMFEATKYFFYMSLVASAVMCVISMVIELLLGMEENQRELVELNKIRIQQEDNREILENPKK